MRKKLHSATLLLCITLLSACGGGGGGGSAAPGGTIKAVIKTSAQSAAPVAGIQLSITVPVGVSPPLKTDGSIDTAATVEITSSAPQNLVLPGAAYIPATASAAGKLTISAINLNGFTPTDTITIHLNVSVGAFPVGTDFKLLSFDAFDTPSGAVVPGLNPILTVTIQ